MIVHRMHRRHGKTTPATGALHRPQREARKGRGRAVIHVPTRITHIARRRARVITHPTRRGRVEMPAIAPITASAVGVVVFVVAVVVPVETTPSLVQV